MNAVKYRIILEKRVKKICILLAGFLNSSNGEALCDVSLELKD